MKNVKTNVEILLVKAELSGVPEKGLLKSRNLMTVDLVWPRTGVAKKSSARQVDFRLGKADFTSEPWAKRILYREEIEGRCGIAVSVTEPLSVQKARKFLKLVAKAALKEGASMIDASLLSYGDLAAAPVEALAAMVGTAETPKAIAQGLIDFEDLPTPGTEELVVVPLERPLTHRPVGTLTLLVRG